MKQFFVKVYLPLDVKVKKDKEFVMMKKLLLILAGVILAVGVLGAAGYAFAQTGDTPEVETTNKGENGDFPGIAGKRGGRWFGFDRGEGLLSDYMFPEMARIFGLSDDQVAAFEKVKETMQGIKDAYTFDEIREMMKEAFTSAIDAAVADDAITQEEADQMLERMEQLGERDSSPFGGRGMRGNGKFPGFNLENRGMRGEFPRSGFAGRGEGILGEYMQAALADALDLSVEELQALKSEGGFNLADYAVDQGMTVEELQDMMQGVYTNAINAALEDEAITQDQADRMLELLENYGGRMPFHPGFHGFEHGN
jgi:hypothetical protein